MSVFDDPRGKLQWLEDELLEEELDEEEYEEDTEEEEDYRPLVRWRRKNVRHAVYADERQLSDRDAVFVEKKKRKGKGTGGLKFLAFLELIGILAVVWWWIKWLY